MAAFLCMDTTLTLDAKSVLSSSFVDAMGVSAVLNDHEWRPGQRSFPAVPEQHDPYITLSPPNDVAEAQQEWIEL